MDNSIQMLSDKVLYIASKNTWIEGLAIEQLLGAVDLCCT
ncbi:hypothetical protein GAPWKB30_1117 [Gilliamella apicola]|nr:hypothetical protein GAPWKB30_1117 [Gilliamella apicola]